MQTNTESHSPQGLRNRRCSFSSNNLLPGGGSHKASPRLLPRLSNSTLYDATFCQCLPACVHLLLRSIVTERKTDGGLPVSEYACRPKRRSRSRLPRAFRTSLCPYFGHNVEGLTCKPRILGLYARPNPPF